jgi:hypothetical protein
MNKLVIWCEGRESIRSPSDAPVEGFAGAAGARG